MKNLKELEKIIQVSFKNPALLEGVFIHRSYLNEHPDFKLGNNERLEFLGDAVIELAVTDYLYQNFPNPEGELTNLRSSIVKGLMLGRIAKELKLGDYLFLSRGEQKSGGRTREIILANTFEALVGAIYLDQGYGQANVFIKDFLLIHLQDIIDRQLYRDPKSSLQEWAQANKGITPRYQVIEESGPDHDKHFSVGVYLDEELLSRGEGASKQKAQEQAAKDALKKI